MPLEDAVTSVSQLNAITSMTPCVELGCQCDIMRDFYVRDMQCAIFARNKMRDLNFKMTWKISWIIPLMSCL